MNENIESTMPYGDRDYFISDGALQSNNSTRVNNCITSQWHPAFKEIEMSISEACNDNSNFLNAMMNIEQVSHIALEPFSLFRPKLYKDGNQWCALYGENLQDGVAGFGKSPDEAQIAFNKAWKERI